MVPTVSRIVGQLGFLFEDDPSLRDESAEVLAQRLDHDDRMARARSEEPRATREEVEAIAAQLEPHITVALVEVALDEMSEP